MAELKTKPTGASVTEFLNGIADEQKRQDAFTILALMQEITGAPAKMWGSAIIGFGDSHYQYESGREGDWFLTGFSPRKQNLTLYINGGFDAHGELMKALGKHKIGKGCLYIHKLRDIDLDTLRELIRRSVEQAAGDNVQGLPAHFRQQHRI
jgi:hypothetical protein